jgi:hypothetical protein
MKELSFEILAKTQTLTRRGQCGRMIRNDHTIFRPARNRPGVPP